MRQPPHTWNPSVQPTEQAILKKSLINSLINGTINAAINWHSFAKQDAVAISLDNISNRQTTVLGQGVLMALTLSVVITAINFSAFKKVLQKADGGREFPHRFWPWGARLAVHHSLTAFGATMILAVLWQRFVGTIMVSPVAATAIVFLIAGGLIFHVSRSTMTAMLRSHPGP